MDAGHSKRPTVKDVARLAQVHFTTVSLALRDHPRIPQATRDRIRRIAEEIGYKRDPLFMALVARRGGAQQPVPTPRMAFITNRSTREAFDAGVHLRGFYEGARLQAEAMGYSCDLLFAGPGAMTAEALSAHLKQTGTEGVIIGAFEPQLGTIEMDWSRYAVVKIDARYMAPVATFVSNDQMQVARLAHQRLRALGYRRIGMAINRHDEEATGGLFSAGCLVEQVGFPLSERVPPLSFGYNLRMDSAARQFREWVLKHRIDAVLCNWTSILDLAAAAGFRVPGDLACCCVCLTEPVPEGLAGVVQNHRAVGQKAAEALALSLKTGARGVPARPSFTYVEGYWRDGASAPAVV
ncbi:MAG TPA: LacI family DNA-binding transcriptional regulator [Opitutaceae bacterium]|jgi:DNA-binding LacI/PurR family transcriptional regulator|nr:LacI family DNA-binding transcriptional regulator [Opitutaceae bacterium]OQB97871.1 MAG: trehalose repressor [Verrucomicrobia bacterium ADurb.Bin122]HNW41202.1 LacI family DNA-binding transcriptional regulator [Opitutaceae bacterium]HOF08512.1 LacI family DNA-binding transcriptional regulator [Opitutaceae bacterium]HPK48095.1 LacI family DNA-binding transcriptional regulator [Opitutaceae bacterium]